MHSSVVNNLYIYIYYKWKINFSKFWLSHARGSVITVIRSFIIRLFVKIRKTNPQLTQPQLGVKKNLKLKK